VRLGPPREVLDEAVLDSAGRPPLNLRFIFEGEEECGGRVIFDLLRAEPERTRADAVLVCDSSFYAPGIPAVYTALRGLCYAEISVRTLERDLHSGTYGGVAPNALETLVRILAGLKDEDGEIRVPKLYKAAEALQGRARPGASSRSTRRSFSGRR
jgi:acetylornithine deacetylase/succinyl-diaminopimelate desuccinylase-like protein